MTPVIDVRCPWVTFQDSALVKVHSVGYVPAELSQGRLGIYVYTLRNKVPVWGVTYRILRPDGAFDDFETMPDFVLSMAGGGFNEGQGVGPFTAALGGAKVMGMGLPENRHVVYIVQFDLKGELPTLY